MAENKTEQPTEKRLREARKKGEVFKSADLTQAFLFFAISAFLFWGGTAFIDEWKALAADCFSLPALAESSGTGPLLQRAGKYLARSFVLVTPLLGFLLAIALLANFAQVRALFATEVLAIKFERINPAAGFRRLFFEARTYIEFAKTLVKLGVVLALAYLVLRNIFPQVMLSGRVDLKQTGILASHAIFTLLFCLSGTFLLLGAGDYFLQRKLYMKKMMMTKEEVKREIKQEEGDPQIRARRRQTHREILAQNVAERVPQATALVVNPTHLAIAIRYDEKSMEAPEITAKGQEQLAQKMIRLAKDHRVPILRNVPLAHSLYQLDVDSQIPEELYNAVAEVLTWVYDLTQRESI